MIIKHSGSKKRDVSQFGLLGTKETALCKAFPYVMTDEAAFPILMRELFGITYAKKYFQDLSVNIEEKYRSIGRTDIEAIFGDYKIVIEAKVGNNTISGKQLTKYKVAFSNEPNRIMCFLTNNNPPTRLVEELTKSGIIVRFLAWEDIIFILDKQKVQSTTVKEFISYYKKGYEMRNIKEIAIRNVSNSRGNSKNQLKEFYIYRSQAIVGTPLYFAPYFTKSDKDGESGLRQISRVLGVLTVSKDDEIGADRLQGFTDDEGLIKRWLDGILDISQTNVDTKTKEFTYYFLDKPIDLPIPLYKDGGIEKGRGKNWVAAMINKGASISFADLLFQINKQGQPTPNTAFPPNGRKLT